jgi:predicted small lipoprotein YifL
MHHIPHRQLVMVLLVTAITVAACGQKGPLYMPDKNQDEQKQDEQKQHNEQKQQKG